jgi:hypothetical protein
LLSLDGHSLWLAIYGAPHHLAGALAVFCISVMRMRLSESSLREQTMTEPTDKEQYLNIANQCAASHRYFGTVTEVMDDIADKHGVVLLVQDAEPNFTTPQPASKEARHDQ